MFFVRLKKFLSIKRAYDDTSAGKWENPGGKKEIGENIVDTLKREVFEETGIEVTNYKLLYASAINEKKNPFMIIGFLVTTETEEVKLSSEHIEYKWASIEELMSLVDIGIQQDFMDSKIEELIKTYN